MSDAVAWVVVKRAAAGDPAARRDLVNATLDNLWSLAMRLTRRPEDADDVVQETYARMFAALSGLEPSGRFEGYLARIATNLVLERWRRHRPSAPIAETIASPDAVEPWQTVADQEEDQPRAAVLLFYAHGESCEGIGQILDVPVGTIKTWLHRARNQVRQTAESLLSEPAIGRPRTGDAS
jgi:RNA polymerase sigma-70 factor (ECF subfamily)